MAYLDLATLLKACKTAQTTNAGSSTYKKQPDKEAGIGL